MKITAHTFMHDFGQMMETITVEMDGAVPAVTPEDFSCTGCFGNIGGSVPCKGVTAVETRDNVLTVTVDPFLYRCNFSVSCEKLGLQVTGNTVDQVCLFHEELFRPCVENGVVYRIYEPNAHGPRPLILFLHGGGACGTDNMQQLTDTLGPIKLAERLPDMYVMAPQAPAGNITMEEMVARNNARHNPFQVIVGEDAPNGEKDRGWVRGYLGKVADLIRRMIDEGKVDPHRVYVTGLSMGGCGTIKMVSVAPDLFAACVPICPSMNGETWPILANFPEVPVYVATSYIDHAVGRHAYIMRAVQQLWDRGRRDVRFTIFTPEELEAYGIGLDPNVPARELYAENHNSWILVYHNEYGIMDWMLSHRKQ